jgi:hypothetical protein
MSIIVHKHREICVQGQLVFFCIKNVLEDALFDFILGLNLNGSS